MSLSRDTLFSYPRSCPIYLSDLCPILPDAASANGDITLSPDTALLFLGLGSRYRTYRGPVLRHLLPFEESRVDPDAPQRL